MKKATLKRTVLNEMGFSYDAQIIIDALLEKDCFLFSNYQLEKFNKYCKRFNINKTATKTDYYWTIR